jgi:cell division protein FtsB
MRHSTALLAPGTPRPRPIGVRRTVILVAILVATVWAVSAYAQEAYIGHKLSQQVSDLRRQNGLLAAENQGYHRDIQAIANGAANEEEARLNGYARPQEHVYLVTTPPPPSPSPSPSARASASPTPKH